MAGTPYLAIMLFGTEKPAAETRLLKAGPLSAELDAGNLRYIRHDGREAIRAIACVVCDRYRGTFNPGTGTGEGRAMGSATPRRLCRRGRAGNFHTTPGDIRGECPGCSGNPSSSSSRWQEVVLFSYRPTSALRIEISTISGSTRECPPHSSAPGSASRSPDTWRILP